MTITGFKHNTLQFLDVTDTQAAGGPHIVARQALKDHSRWHITTAREAATSLFRKVAKVAVTQLDSKLGSMLTYKGMNLDFRTHEEHELVVILITHNEATTASLKPLSATKAHKPGTIAPMSDWHVAEYARIEGFTS